MVKNTKGMQGLVTNNIYAQKKNSNSFINILVKNHHDFPIWQEAKIAFVPQASNRLTPCFAGGIFSCYRIF